MQNERRLPRTTKKVLFTVCPSSIKISPLHTVLSLAIEWMYFSASAEIEIECFIFLIKFFNAFFPSDWLIRGQPRSLRSF